MRIKLYLALSVFFIFIFAFKVSFADEGARSQLDGFIDRALSDNPPVKAAYNEWKKEEYKIQSLKALPDPKLSYGYFGKSIETKVGPQQQKYGLSQTIPFPGKIRLRSEAQEKKAGILKEKYEGTKRDVINEVKITYFDIFWVDKAIQINEEEKSLIEDIEKVAQRRYESNLLPQHNVIKLQVEISNIIKKLILLKEQRRVLVFKMGVLLNAGDGFNVATIDDLKDWNEELNLDDLLKKAKEDRQELKSAGLEVQKAKIEKELALKNYLPDFTFGYEYIQIGSGTTTLSDDGRDAWMGTVSINLPIWDKRLKNDVKSAEFELSSANDKKQNIENAVIYDVNDAYLKVITNKDIISLYESAIIPQAKQAFDVSQKTFETGSISFIDWLDTERVYLQTRLAYYKAVSDYHKSISLLEKAIGNRSGGKDEN